MVGSVVLLHLHRFMKLARSGLHFGVLFLHFLARIIPMGLLSFCICSVVYCSVVE